MPLISVRNIELERSGELLLKNVSFDIPEKGRVAIYGPNGSGKNAVVLILAGILKQTQGNVFFRDDVAWKYKRDSYSVVGIGNIPSITPLYDQFTVMENCVFYARFLQLKKARYRIEALLQQWGLKNIRNVRVEEISALDYALLSCALAFLKDPLILLFDEPTGKLTNKEVEIFWGIAGKMFKDKTVIFTTLNEVEAIKHAKKVLHISKGELYDN